MLMEKCARGRDFKDDTIEREMMYSDVPTVEEGNGKIFRRCGDGNKYHRLLVEMIPLGELSNFFE